MGCSAPVSRRVPGSVMSMASALSAASVGPASERRVQQRLHHRLERIEALTQQPFWPPWRGLQPALGDFVEQALLAPQPLQPEGLHRRLMRPPPRPRAPAASSGANAVSSAASSNAVRLGIASFVMPNVQDKPVHELPRIPFSRLQDQRARNPFGFPASAVAW